MAEGFDFLGELGTGDFLLLFVLVGGVVAFGHDALGDAHASAGDGFDVDVVGVFVGILDLVVGDFVEDVALLEFRYVTHLIQFQYWYGYINKKTHYKTQRW